MMKSKAELAAYQRKYRAANKEAEAARVKAYTEANREKINAYHAAYRETNRNTLRAKACEIMRTKRAAAKEAPPPIEKHMPLKFSYSAVKDFENCPRKYHEVRILKQFKSSDTEATIYGTAVHLAFEEYIRDGTPLPPQYEQYLQFVAPLARLKGLKICEGKLALKADFTPCEYDDPDAWFRGIPDLIVLNPDSGVARVVDYKTGKSSKYADSAQLQLMAAMIMAHHPGVHTVKGVLLFVVAGDAIQTEYTREQLPQILSEWAGRANAVETALESGTWNPKSSGLCGFCPVETCEYHKPRRF